MAAPTRPAGLALHRAGLKSRSTACSSPSTRSTTTQHHRCCVHTLRVTAAARARRRRRRSTLKSEPPRGFTRYASAADGGRGPRASSLKFIACNCLGACVLFEQQPVLHGCLCGALDRKTAINKKPAEMLHFRREHEGRRSLVQQAAPPSRLILARAASKGRCCHFELAPLYETINFLRTGSSRCAGAIGASGFTAATHADHARWPRRSVGLRRECRMRLTAAPASAAMASTTSPD